VVRADSYNANPLNTRQVVRDFSRPRGLIQTADGVILAQSVPSNDRFEFQRVYPTKDLFADITGFFAFTFGSDGVERSANDVLAGRTDSQRGSPELVLRGRDRHRHVTLRAQQVAGRAANNGSGRRADPRDGAILAAAFRPTTRTCRRPTTSRPPTPRQALLSPPGKPPGPRFTESGTSRFDVQDRDPSAGLQSGQVTPTSPSYPAETSYTLPLTTADRELGGALAGTLSTSARPATARSRWASNAEVMVGGARRMASTRSRRSTCPRPRLRSSRR
jgi:hypothetical protein